MLNPRHFLRMKRWAQNPPSWGRAKLVFGVIVVALVIVALEHFGFWPEWAKAERIPRKF